MATDILIVDDEADIRKIIAGILQDEGYATREAGSSAEAMSAIQTRQPNLIILDVWLQNSQYDGLQMLEMIRRDSPDQQVVMISGHATFDMAVRATKMGAYDFLTKPFQDGELLDRVRAAIEHYHARRKHRLELQQVQERIDACTPRERDVMRLLARGLPNKRIGEELGISPRTVEIHRAHLMEKMAADSLPSLVRMLTLLEEDEAGQA